jgi:phosphoribosylaminoimidazole-succinocarboxamide synthase
MTTLLQSEWKRYPLLFRGKVRDVYDLGDELLIVATDRLSAFDVILPDPIPEKGRVLTEITKFWMEKFRGVVPNHESSRRLEDVVTDKADYEVLKDRAVIVKKARALPVECVVRGYLIGSGWKDYQKTGKVCGITLPQGLNQASRLPEPIFTPSSKAEQGLHDENITFSDVERLVGGELAARLRDVSLKLYAEGARHAESRGIIVADTKFEFGLVDGTLTLIDEVLTPDSSRFWPKSEYREGTSPPSFDKQFVRDYLESLDWDKRAPGPRLPVNIIEKTSKKYLEALRILTQ